VFQLGVDASYGLTDCSIFMPPSILTDTRIAASRRIESVERKRFFPALCKYDFPTIPATGTPGYVEDFPFAANNNGGVGEITVGLKFGLLSERRGAPFSLSVRNDVIIPTWGKYPAFAEGRNAIRAIQ